jgi:hypothetical protein
MMTFDKNTFNTSLASKRLIRESEWMRVYQLGENEFYYESKFATDRLELKPRELKKKWQTYNTEAKRDFVEAYSVKAELSDDDFEILRYLMKEGSDETWRWIAVRLTELPEKADIRTFLLARIEAAGSSFPDYIQALELLGDSKAAGVIARKFETYGARIAALADASTPESFFDCVCYLSCCRALVKLVGSHEAEAALDSMQSFPDERVQTMARSMRVNDNQ